MIGTPNSEIQSPKSEPQKGPFRILDYGFRIFLGVLLATLLGCTRPQARGQREEESDRERYPVKLVGDVTTFSNADPIPVHGVGLVEDLDGTGGPAWDTTAEAHRRWPKARLLCMAATPAGFSRKTAAIDEPPASG